MRFVPLLAAPAAAAALLLAAGCSAPKLQLASDHTVTQRNVMGNIWERYELWPREDNPMPVKEGVSAHAQAFCAEKGMDFQPLDSAVTRGEKDASGKLVKGASAALRFRCMDASYSKMD